jgi:trehalose utilization protein
VVHRVTVVDADHPVTRGIPDAFDLEDELYLMPTLEDDVVPLLRSDARFTTDEFYSAGLAVQGQRDTNAGWTHPPGSDLVGWAKRVGSSPIVYLQPGHGPATYASPAYRQLLGNAIRYVASDDAHAWATEGGAVGPDGARSR